MKNLALALLGLLFVGCSDNQGTQSRIGKLEERIATLQARDSILESQLASRITDVKILMASKIESESAAVLHPDSKGYAIARNEYGGFPVILEDAQPYLDGHKVKFRVGNLTSAELTDVKLDIVYGVRDPVYAPRDAEQTDEDRVKEAKEYLATVEQNKKTRRKLTVDAGKDLSPASWNSVEVILSPSKPEDLGRIEVSVKITAMKLPTPK